MGIWQRIKKWEMEDRRAYAEMSINGWRGESLFMIAMGIFFIALVPFANGDCCMLLLGFGLMLVGYILYSVAKTLKKMGVLRAFVYRYYEVKKIKKC